MTPISIGPILTKSTHINVKDLHIAKLQIISDISKENFKVVDFEDATVAYFATFTGGKQLDVAPAPVKIVSQGDTVAEFKDGAVGLPYGNIDRVAGI